MFRIGYPLHQTLSLLHAHTHTHTWHTCDRSDSAGYTKDVALGEFHANQNAERKESARPRSEMGFLDRIVA